MARISALLLDGSRIVAVGTDCDRTGADCHPVTWLGTWNG